MATDRCDGQQVESPRENLGGSVTSGLSALPRSRGSQLVCASCWSPAAVIAAQLSQEGEFLQGGSR